MLSVARQDAKNHPHSNIDFLQGDAYHLPEPDASFDVALLFYVLDIVEQPEAVLREARRVLKSNGILISVTDCYQDISPVSPVRHLLREAKWNARLALRNVGLGSRSRSTLRDTQIVRMTSDSGFRPQEFEVIETGEKNQYNLYLKSEKV